MYKIKVHSKCFVFGNPKSKGICLYTSLYKLYDSLYECAVNIKLNFGL